MMFDGYIWLFIPDTVTARACLGRDLILPVSQNPTHRSHLNVFTFALQAFS